MMTKKAWREILMLATVKVLGDITIGFIFVMGFIFICTLIGGYLAMPVLVP